jgi:hypothetical protein
MEGIQTINALKAVVSSLPAQTTIPSSELVMLYAADGTPIAKIARDDLVKAVASVMASNSQNTFSKLLGVQANGTPMGIGASDLASVLGVNLFGSNYFSDDCNDLGPGVVYAIAATHAPTNYCYILTLGGSSNDRVQYAAKIGESYMWVRNKSNGIWSDWVRCDNFGCNSLSDLASALGGIVKEVDSGDLNTLINERVYFLANNSDSYSNLPSDINLAPRAFLEVLYNSNKAYIMQRISSAVRTSAGNATWTRCCDGGTWTSWKKVSAS